MAAMATALAVCAGAMAQQTTITVAPSTGTFYRDIGGTSDWKDRWVSNDSPTITIADADGSTTNNMTFDNNLDGITLAEGSGNNSYSYTVSVESDYVITGMTVTVQTNAEDMTVTIGDETVTSAESPKEVTLSGISEHQVSITVSSSDGTNENATLYGWTVTVEPAEDDGSFKLAPSTGTFTRDKSSSSWYDKWTSNGSPTITIEDTDGSNDNNMQGDTSLDGIKLAEGTNHSTFDFTVAVEDGYVFTSMTVTVTTEKDDMTVTIGDQTITLSANEPQTVALTDISQQEIGITLSSSSGTNEIATFYDWTVTVDAVESDEEQTDTDTGDEEEGETTITVAPSTGTFYRDSGGISDWKDRWVSNDNPTITLANADGSTTNNMSFDNTLDGIQLAEGSGSLSYNFSVSAESGYMVTGMTFTIITDEGINDMTVTVDGSYSVVPSSTPQTVVLTDLNKPTVNILVESVSAKNETCTLYDWTVTVAPYVADKDPHIIVSTDEEQHWYYIYSTSTKSYCVGKAWYYDAESAQLHFEAKTLQPNYLWSFWQEEEDGEMAIKCYQGGWVNNPDKSNTFTLVDEPNYAYSVEFYEDGSFCIHDSNYPNSTYQYIHAQENNMVLVHWNLASGNASMWNFQEVDMSGDNDVELTSTAVVQGKVTTGRGNTNDPIIRSTMTLAGLDGEAHLQGVSGRIKATDLSDVTAVKAYLASNSRELYVDPTNSMPWREQTGTLFAEGTIDAEGNYTIEGDTVLSVGTHYLWICLDIAEDAGEGNTVDATITSYTINGETIAEASGDPTYEATIFLTESTPLMPMDLGSLYYRIPAITTTADGSRIVILSDDRTDTNGDLPTHVWVVAQYSDDGGLTWSEPVKVAGTAETGGDYGHGDASLITNRINGDIIGIMTSSPYGIGFNGAFNPDTPQAWKTIVSHDNGTTWEAPVDHTLELYGTGSPNPNWGAGFSGSGAGLQKRDGTLVSPFVNKEQDENGNQSQNFYLFMSKDGGDTWYVSGTSGTTACDEPKVLERNNGDLAISVRATGYNYYNYTYDDGETWKNAAQTRFTSGISGNACDGDYMVWCSTLDGNAQDIAFQTAPNNSSRMNVSIALSEDEGETFFKTTSICPRGSAYSSATVLPDGTLGVYYEENGVYGGFTMRFVRFSLDWASGGKYKFTDDEPYRPVHTCVNYEMPDCGWNTIVLPFEAELPSELTAYACLDSTLTYTEDGDTVTAILLEKTGTATLAADACYVLSGEEGTYTFTHPLSEWTARELPEGCERRTGSLVGHMVGNRVYGDDETLYNNVKKVTAYDDARFKRIPATGYVNMTANCCHLQLSEASEEYLMPMDVEDVPTGILGIETAQRQSAPRAYNLQGIPRREGERGIFIVDGRTVLIK